MNNDDDRIFILCLYHESVLSYSCKCLIRQSSCPFKCAFITVHSVANLNYAWFCLKAVCLSLEQYSKNDGWMVIDCI